MMFRSVPIHPSWQPLVNQALTTMDREYLRILENDEDWLPGVNNVFNAFSSPLDDTHYILFGESPYPRKASANGFAFWDAAVNDLWSPTGLTKTVNRATSLRNLIKMLLVATEDLDSFTNQEAIAAIDKTAYVCTIEQLFNNFIASGFVLLNASLVFRESAVRKDASAWLPFMQQLLQQLVEYKPDLCLLLFGNIAKTIDTIAPKKFSCIHAEHPYNISFIHNPVVLDFFRPLDLLRQR